VSIYLHPNPLFFRIRPSFLEFYSSQSFPAFMVSMRLVSFFHETRHRNIDFFSTVYLPLRPGVGCSRWPADMAYFLPGKDPSFPSNSPLVRSPVLFSYVRSFIAALFLPCPRHQPLCLPYRRNRTERRTIPLSCFLTTGLRPTPPLQFLNGDAGVLRHERFD